MDRKLVSSSAQKGLLLPFNVIAPNSKNSIVKSVFNELKVVPYQHRKKHQKKLEVVYVAVLFAPATNKFLTPGKQTK
jgi:hypothetical protein